jgi:hypothetical protein
MAVVLRAVQGATFADSLTLLDDAGAAFVIDDMADVRWLAKERVSDADDDAILSASVADDTIVASETPGVITFAIPAADMALVEGDRVYVWTLEVVDDDVVTRFPSAEDGPGKLLVVRSAIADQPA